eukprot:g1376.t1
MLAIRPVGRHIITHSQFRRRLSKTVPTVKRLSSIAPPSVKLYHPRRSKLPRCAAAPDKLTGIVFEPCNEAQVELATIDKTNNEFDSMARSGFTPECEAALNEQINVEYNVSYVYHALFAYFDRDNVALPGMAEFFKKQSEEEREHAEKCMEYQNLRGGRVQLQSITPPTTEFLHEKKGDALYAMELALSLEKLNFQKLRDLWDVADKSDDAQMCDFIESELLNGQVESIKQISEYVAQLRRVGLGHGVFHFDRTLNDVNK